MVAAAVARLGPTIVREGVLPSLFSETSESEALTTYFPTVANASGWDYRAPIQAKKIGISFASFSPFTAAFGRRNPQEEVP
jgi:hypothetical protein